MRPCYINPPAINEEEVRQHLDSGSAVDFVFFEGSYSNDVLPNVNRLCRRYGKAVGVKIGGQMTGDGRLDAKILRQIPDVVSLCIVARSVDHLAVLGELPALRGLGLHTYLMAEPRVLHFSNLAALEHLELTSTYNCPVDLAPLANMRKLRELCLDGQEKSIAAATGLPELRLVSLRSISKRTDLGFLGTLPALKSLDLTLGGHTGFDGIASATLDDLRLTQILGFAEGDFPPRFPNLRSLSVHNQIRLRELTFSSGNSAMHKLEVFSCSGLSRIWGLSHLQNLEELKIFGTKISFDDVMNTPLPPSLSVFGFYAKHKKTDVGIRRILDAKGYSEFPHRTILPQDEQPSSRGTS